MVNTGVKLPGPVEVDETYIGGLEGNKHEHKRLQAGRGTGAQGPPLHVFRINFHVHAPIKKFTSKPTIQYHAYQP